MKWSIVAECGAVQPVNIRTRLLKLQLIEECIADIHTLVVKANRIDHVLSNLTGPVIETALIQDGIVLQQSLRPHRLFGRDQVEY